MTALTYKASKTFSKFHHDDTFIRIVMGPVGCMRGDSLVITEEGALPIEQIDRPMRVLSWNYHKGQFQYSLTGGAFPKGRGSLYRVKTTQGEFVAAEHHRVLCADGTYQRVDTLYQGQTVSLHSSSPDEKCSELCSQASSLSVQNYSQTLVNLMGGYAALARQYGQQLLEAQDTFPDFVPPQDDVHKLYQSFGISEGERADVLEGNEQLHIHQDQHCGHKSIDDYDCPTERPHLGEARCVSKEPCEHNAAIDQQYLQSQPKSDCHSQETKSSLCSRSSINSISNGYILEIERLPVKEVYWDLQVLDTNNYVTSDGTIHHNSGKSVGCCWEVYLRALKQKPNSDGVRMSRWVIVRNTLPELETTTMATWKQWFGEHIFKGAKITGRAPYKQTIEHAHPTGDGTTLHLELVFLALDGQEDIKKLMSLECTGIFFNELRFIDEVIFREACTRPGRYPRKIDGGPTWHGIIADTNPPDDSHWMYKLVEEIKPSNVSMYYQPSGMAPLAENRENLPDGYYENMSIGKSQEWINVYVHGKYGFMQEGKSVYAETWDDDFHYSQNPIDLIPGRTLVGGIDASGRSPAAVVMQSTPLGQTQVLWELCGEDVGAVMFAKLLRQEVANTFPQNNITWWGDPAGAFKSQNDERTYFEILRGEGVIVQPSPGFRTNERVEGVRSILSRNIGGKPALLVGPECKQLRKGFNGGYRYKKIGSSGSARYTPEPEKNEYSHCFAAGTMVATNNGQAPIESINVGDLVYTPLGYKRVLNTMNKLSSVVEVKVGNEKIICTPDHKFATPYGYSRADALQYGSVIRKESLWAGKLFMKLKSLQEQNTILNQTGITKQITNRAGSICTGRFGNTTTALFQKVCKFITSMGTRQTTELKTLNYCHQLTTQRYILQSDLMQTQSLFTGQSALHKRPQRLGTVVMPEENGIVSTLSGLPQIFLSCATSVLNAVKNILVKREQEKSGIVHLLVSLKRAANLASMMLKETALIAALNLLSIATPKQKRVVVSVQPRSELRTVYDLTIEDAHCFYAQGILVSNCHEALQYGIAGMGELNTMKQRKRSDYKTYTYETNW